jgi:hypothetical protein
MYVEYLNCQGSIKANGVRCASEIKFRMAKKKNQEEGSLQHQN